MANAKILGLLIGASLLIGYEPAVEAMPAATLANPQAISNSDGLIAQAYVRGVARRTTRRVVRRHY